MNTTKTFPPHPTNAVCRFERAFADCVEASSARAFWMGRVGLYATLRALGVTAGDRVGICSYTCVAVVEAVTRLKAVPIFLDVDRHMNIAPRALHKLTQPLKALVLQHTFGVPCEIDESLAWARARGIPVVEDCCHALGAQWRGESVGRFGCAAIFSFQWGKPFTTGQGGMATFMDAHLAHEVDRVIAAEGRRPPELASVSLSLQRCLYPHVLAPSARRLARSLYHWACSHRLALGSEPRVPLVGGAEGFLRTMSLAQARAGLRQLSHWREILRKRLDEGQTLASRLRTAGIPWVEPQPWVRPMYLRFPVRVAEKNGVLAAADRAGLDVAGWYLSPAHPLRGASLAAIGYTAGQCPGAEEAFDRVVTLPTFPALNARDLERAIEIIATALER
jgi:dTDP-4-amino-4,6-dideoxygalactose transaminase